MNKYSDDEKDKIRTDEMTEAANDAASADAGQTETEVTEASQTEHANDAANEATQSPETAPVAEATPEDKMAELQDRYLRLAAEFDNFRKRTRREKAELIETAGESLLKELLPVVDDFERGLDALDKASDLEAVKTGMRLIHNKLKDFLTSQGLSEVMASGEMFDADRHEAVTNIPAPSDELKGKVVDVIQKGYALRDKIIRYPKVVVGE